MTPLTRRRSESSRSYICLFGPWTVVKRVQCGHWLYLHLHLDFFCFSAACGDKTQLCVAQRPSPCFQREVDVLGDLERVCLKGRMGAARFLSGGLAAPSPSWACLVLSGLPVSECVFVRIIWPRCCCCQALNGARRSKQTSGFVVATEWSLPHSCYGRARACARASFQSFSGHLKQFGAIAVSV